MQSRISLGFAILFTIYAYWLGGAEHSAFTQVATAGVGLSWLCTVLVVAQDRSRLRELSATIQLLVMAGMVISNLVGLRLLSFDPFHDPRYAIFLSSILVLCALGIQFRWFVSRWMALALACAGIASAGLNLVPWYGLRGAYTWTLAIHIAGALLVIANLSGPTMRRRFEERANPLWSSADPMLRSIRWTILAFFGAIPMLLVYSWMQPIVSTTQLPALLLALFLSVSIVLSVSKRVLGALGLVLGGVALLALSGTTLSLAYQRSAEHGRVAVYYAAFWVPAGLAALHCGIRMAGPLLRLLAGQGKAD
jgi:hypothetical protein